MVVAILLDTSRNLYFVPERICNFLLKEYIAGCASCSGCTNSNWQSDWLPKKEPVMASSSNVSALLKQLSSASQTLSEASNKLTEQIKEIENSLAAFNLGIVAWVELRRTSEEVEEKDGTKYRLQRIERLGYSKKNGKWGLCASSGIEEFEEDFEWWLLRDAPRGLRILAVDGIPKLLEEMVNRAKKLTIEVNSKTDQAKALAHSLRAKPKKAGE